MEFSKEQIEKAKKCQTLDEFKELAKKEGFNLSEEEAKNYFEATHSQELNDDELASVAGGKGWDVIKEQIVSVNCPFCGKPLKIRYRKLKHSKSGEIDHTLRPNECSCGACIAYIIATHTLWFTRDSKQYYIPMPK